MAALRTILADNGSLNPEATLALRKLASRLSLSLGRKVEPVSVLHSDKVDPALLGGYPAEIFESFARRILREGDQEDPRLASLSDQERRILALIAEGLTNREIGGEMHLAEKTVKNYVSNLLAKLDMQRRTEAAVFYTQVSKDQPTRDR
jgi:DNA-binding NarL/FixJ family response regulator